MGLFERAISAQIPVRKGLLKKSSEIIAGKHQKAKTGSYSPITQAQLDSAAIAQKSKKKSSAPPSEQKKKRRSAQTPLTWKEASFDDPPSLIGPTIKEEELELSLANRQCDRVEEIKAVFKEIAELGDGIEAPAQLFAILQENLHLTKAALLLYDPIRMVFAPWASVGYDKTTHHRLRISLGFNKYFNRVANGTVLNLTTEQELEGFKNCFSSREYAALTQLILSPVIFNEKLIAILLITHMEESHFKDILALLSEISIQAAPAIFRAREEKLKNIRQESLVSPEPLEDSVQKLARNCQKQGFSLVMIKLSLEKVIQSIISHNALLDPFRLKEDISSIIYSLLYEIGAVHNLDQNHILLLIHNMQAPDPELLIHHIGLTLKMFFRELPKEQRINFNEEVSIFPEDREDVLELLSELA